MKPQQWRRSSVGRYLRHLPRIKHIRGTWLHRRLGERFFASEMWHPDRSRFAAGAAVGMFFGMIPLPLQMVGAALIAYLTKANIPAAIGFTWISNPLTMPFFLYLQFKIGAFLMGRMGENIKMTDVWSVMSQAPLPLLLGAVVSGVIFSLITYPLAFVGWDWLSAKFQKSRKCDQNKELPRE